jgi:hypothetical protein
MVNGRLEAIGSPQALKDLYGQEITLQLNAAPGRADELEE